MRYLLIIALALTSCQAKMPEVGSTWCYVPRDPFNPDYHEVLETKEGWIKHVSSNGDTLTSHYSLFINKYRLVE